MLWYRPSTSNATPTRGLWTLPWPDELATFCQLNNVILLWGIGLVNTRMPGLLHGYRLKYQAIAHSCPLLIHDR